MPVGYPAFTAGTDQDSMTKEGLQLKNDSNSYLSLTVDCSIALHVN